MPCSPKGGGHGDAKRAYRWVIDPLDGTVSFAHGYPRLRLDRRRAARRALGGRRLDPLLDETFHVVRGGGAFRNGQRISVSGATDVAHGLFSTGFAYDVHTSPDTNLARFAAFVKTARAVRRDGSAALDLCYVAAGRFEGYWECKLKPWDVCAGALVVSEAGGRISDLSGGELPPDGGEIVASNALVHDEMLRLLQRAGSRG